MAIRDLTERRQAEHDLRESQRVLATLFEFGLELILDRLEELHTGEG